MKRQYTFLAMRPGTFEFWPARLISSDCKIRTVASVMFRKWFGHAPNESWHADGFMAEAWDRQGHRIQIEQVNKGDRLFTEN